MGGYLFGRKSNDTQVKKFCLPEKKGALFELKKNADDVNEALEFKYIEKIQVSHDTFIFAYEIPNKMTLGLNLGHHIAIDAQIESKENETISRKYTPVSHIFEEGKFKLLVKVYFKDVHPMFPNGGIMSQYLNDLNLEKSIKVRGPFGKLTYLGDGEFKILKKFKPLTYVNKNFKKVAMLAGGTGITPFYQIIQAAHQNGDTTEFTLLFGNKTKNDILLMKEIEEVQASKTFNFKCHFLIDKQEPEWSGLTGYISKDMILKYLPLPSAETMVLICGPPVMCERAKEFFGELKYDTENIYEF